MGLKWYPPGMGPTLDEQIAMTPEQYFGKRPNDANPYAGGALPSVNIYRKYQNKLEFSIKEKNDFNCVCDLGANQIISCYGPTQIQEDGSLSVVDLIVYCSKCPHHKAKFSFKWDNWDCCINQDLFCSDFIYDKCSKYIAKSHGQDMDTNKCQFDGKWFVYFISDGYFVKIGYASDLKKRISGIQVGNPRKVEFIALIPCLDRWCAQMVERELHFWYRHFAMNGEWFNILDRLEYGGYLSDILTEFDPSMYL